MRREDIISRLKEYQAAEKSSGVLEELSRVFLAGIHPRIREKHGHCAECAVRKVLEAMFAIPLHPLLCVDAMTQLCRDDVWEFTEYRDEDLVCSINMRYYFTPLTLDRLYVETQDGVV